MVSAKSPKAATSKAKGRRLQQLVRDAILTCFPSLQPDDVRSTAMGQSGEDIQLSPAARKVFPYSVECKNRAGIVVYTWWHQTKKNAPKGTRPILVIKQDRDRPLVVMDFEEWMNDQSNST